MKTLFWSLVVLVVLALGADRGGDALAERVVAGNLQREQSLPQRPDVDIDGFPFLDQFAQGRYEHVRAEADTVPVRGAGLSLTDVRLDFRGVTTNRDFSRFSARRATASGTIGYDALGRLLGVDLSYAGDGRVRATQTIDALGGSFDASATLEPTYERGSLTLGGFQLADDLPDGIADRLRDAVDDAVRLDELPFDVTVQSVRATGDGLEVQLRGTDLSYTT